MENEAGKYKAFLFGLILGSLLLPWNPSGSSCSWGRAGTVYSLGGVTTLLSGVQSLLVLPHLIS